MAPKTIATQGGGYAGGLVNQGVYLPLGLAAQTGLSFTGTHTNTFGVNPFSPGQQRPSLAKQISSLGLVQYEKAILGVGGNGERLIGGLVSPLANLYEDKIIIKSPDPNVVEYGGGPGAPLGIGKTQIRYSSISYGQNRTGDNNPLAVTDKEYFYVGLRPNSRTLDNLRNNPVFGAIDYEKVNGFGGSNNNYTDTLSAEGGYTWENINARKIYESGSLSPLTTNDLSSRPQTVDDFVNISSISNPTLSTPEGPTTYADLLNDGTSLNPDVTSNGGLTFTDPNQNKTTIGSGNTALNFNNEVVEITNRYKNIQFTSTQDKSSDLTDFRGLPIPLLAPVSNGFNQLNNVFGTMKIDFTINAGVGQSVYKNGIGFGQTGSDAIETNVEFIKETGNGVSTWTQGDFESLTDSDLFPQTQQIRDFRNDILELDVPADSTKKVLSKFNGDYNTKKYSTRTNAGDPGARRNVQNYSVGGQAALDKINASPIYSSAQATHTGDKNDLVKFSMGYVQNNNSGNTNFMNFRAFLGEFTDSYTSDWGETQYVGRADKFYNYKGFSREIQISWTVFAQSKAELIPMYKKLNFLASGCAPSYSTGGFMQGNLMRLTVGGYLFNQLGFIKGITYTVPTECTWEIAIDNAGGSDSSVKELPHMIKVSGFTFTPIQEFVPRIANPDNLGNTPYIALNNGVNNNYA
tara:strand:- start:820 stop:2886 length:2067 start_codon:yes stop_codon:yes gene_type:complete